MSIMIIYGIPESFVANEIREKLRPALLEAIVSLKELDLNENQVSFFFPRDKLRVAIDQKIIIFVEGLFEREKRTNEVRNRLAENLVKAAKKHFAAGSVIKCFIKPFDPELGFCSSTEIEI